MRACCVIVIALLVAKRIAYHLTYLLRDPFALATFSDGQVYELARATSSRIHRSARRLSICRACTRTCWRSA